MPDAEWWLVLQGQRLHVYGLRQHVLESSQEEIVKLMKQFCFWQPCCACLFPAGLSDVSCLFQVHPSGG